MKIEQENKDQTEIVGEKEIKEETEKKIGFLKPHRGHTIFQYNTIDGRLTKAVFDKVNYVLGQKKQPKRITVEEGCVYISSLNLKNAIKRLSKHYGNNIKTEDL